MHIQSAYLYFLAACVASGFTHTAAIADTITSNGVVHEDCSIQTIRSGNIYYLDKGENLQQIPLEEVTAIEFDNLRELSDGDRYAERKDYLRALDKYQAAYVKAGNDSQQFWIHVKLAETHNKLGDYIEAAGHAAAVVMVDPAEMWLKLLPDCEVNPPMFYSTAEANYFLGRAIRQVEDNEALKRMIETMQTVITPLFEKEKAAKPNHRYRSGSTVSGILRGDVGTDRAKRERPWLDNKKEILITKPSQTDTNAPGNISGKTPGNIPADNKQDSPEAIDALLAVEKYEEALKIIEVIAKRTDSRDLGRFLFQYGEALNGTGKRKDAAIQYMKCVANYSGTIYAPKSLIQTAIIYREVFKNIKTANQLLERAVEKANEIGEGQIAKQASSLIEN